MQRFLFVAALAGLLAAMTADASAALPPLIPRDVLFGNPEKAGPRLSPDGTQLLYLAPSAGVLSVWVRTLGAHDDRVVASDAKRPIRAAYWSPDGSRVLYPQDAGGNENFHVFGADPRGGAAPVDLTPHDGVRADLLDIDPSRPTILITMNRRDKNVFDVWKLDPRDGAATLDTKNPGAATSFGVDPHGVVRAAVVANADGSYVVRVRDGEAAAWRTLTTASADDGEPGIAGFSAAGDAIYLTTSAGANAARLMRYDLASGRSSVTLSDPSYDVSGTYVSQVTKTLVAASIVRERRTWTVLDPAYAADFDALTKRIPGDLDIVSSDRDERTFIVAASPDDASPSFWLYDRATRKARKLFDTRPALARYKLAKMTPVSYTARDGMTIHGYLTTPPGAAAQKHPAVVLVHGGPWARDLWGYNGTVQWLANRGYAVLQPNFRASTGYGKAFLNAGSRQWAGAMHTDLLDAKAWLVKRGIADPARVAIMGGSYGGYATLAALAFSPHAFAAGVDIVGPSNLNTLLASVPPYWSTARAFFARHMGDTEAVLSAQSPLFQADAIVRPLLIGQGANDPRVNVRESDQIVAAMRKNHKPVTYVVFPDEGHGFARPENASRFNAAIEAFLAKYLGGRAQPAGPAETIDAFLK